MANIYSWRFEVEVRDEDEDWAYQRLSRKLGPDTSEYKDYTITKRIDDVAI